MTPPEPLPRDVPPRSAAPSVPRAVSPVDNAQAHLRRHPEPSPPPHGPVAPEPAAPRSGGGEAPQQRSSLFRRPDVRPDGDGALEDHTLEANAYAISFRLLGDRAAASAVAGIAAERLRQNGQSSRPDWLCHLTQYTLDQTAQPGALGASTPEQDRFASLRTALRRRLARATPQERVAGALVHLAGYPPRFVAELLGCSEAQAIELARVLAPPPGVAYRQLGDPQLTRSTSTAAPGAAPRRSRRPGWTTILVVVAVVVLVVGATQATGPRPTLEPPTQEGSAAVDPPDQRNGGPLTQLTNE